MKFHIQGQRAFPVQNPETIVTPRLLVFQERVASNLNRMKSILEETAPGSGYEHVCVHVKTLKSSRLIKMLMATGIRFFKSSFNEVELLGRCGAPDIFVAYPLLGSHARQVARWMKAFPESVFHVQAGNRRHVDILQETAEAEGVTWRFFLDLDVGMHRTGMNPDRALELYRYASGKKGFEFSGLHGYDGHNHNADSGKRMTIARQAMSRLIETFHEFAGLGIDVPRVMTAGTPSFEVDFSLLFPALGGKTRVQVSPGTWVLWDSKSESLNPGQFEMAALILAQVMDRGDGRVTLNLGHKRWAADQGPVEAFSHPGLRVASFSEEHTVLTHDGTAPLNIGDYLLLAPRHVCPTVNLYKRFALLDEKGGMLEMCEVDGRNR